MKHEIQKPYVIGLVLEEMSADFSKELIWSISRAIPANENVRLVVLAGKYLDRLNDTGAVRSYKTVFNSVFRLDDLCDLDGMIIHLGSMSKRRKKIIRTGFSERFQSIPKVFIASDMEGETVINYDNESGIREAVDCLVNVEGLTNFCMLGGRDDNFDARARKEIFIRCLSENNISFSDSQYARTDMSCVCGSEANALLDRNPDVQAIFCVNDAAATGLYAAMAKRGLVPGKDIFVFGFDNTRMAGEMIPTLSSIGAAQCTLGQRAIEVLFDKLSGKETHDTSVLTRLYGRDSFRYEMYDYTTREMLSVDPAFIYRMFDDCMYRYRNANLDRNSVNLRRLFYEIASRMLLSLKRRFMSNEEFLELCQMIDIFFEKGAMQYTDANKLLHSIERLQGAINVQQKAPASTVPINRLFSRMKDRAIYTLSEERIRENAAFLQNRQNLQNFMILSSYSSPSHKRSENIFSNLDKLGIQNAAIYQFDTPLNYDLSRRVVFPEHIRLRCVIRSGEIYHLPPERQSGKLRDMFLRNELPSKCRGYAVLPVFFQHFVYGFLLSELSDDICERGEYIALQLGRAVYLEDTLSAKNSAF